MLLNQPWRIEMLGGLRVSQADIVITRFKTHKAGALLAYLAFHMQQIHSREMLIETFWPEVELSQGRPSLSVALSSLRHQLELPGTRAGSVLITTNTSVQLNPLACTTDVAEFESLINTVENTTSSSEAVALLQRATELYRGELLPGYYDNWRIPEQERLQSLLIRSLRSLVRHLAKERAFREAIPYAERGIAIDPLQEELHRDLMQLYVAAGQPSLALRQYRELEALYTREVGEQPSALTRQLARRITEQLQLTPEIAPKPVPKVPRTAPTVSSPGLPSGMQTFLAIGSLSNDGAEELDPGLRENAIREASAYSAQELPTDSDCLLLAFGRIGHARDCALALQTFCAQSSSMPCLALHTAEIDDISQLRDVIAYLRGALKAGHPGQLLCSEETALFLRRSMETGMRLLDLDRWRILPGDVSHRLFEFAVQETETSRFPPLLAPTGHTANLPMQFTRFVGREAEIAHITSLFRATPATRIVTLTGPGGAGKTRLALEVAKDLVADGKRSVWFVPLADITATDRLFEVIATTLRLPNKDGADTLAQLREHLTAQPTLLLLDNLEQIVESAAGAIHALLEQVPTLCCLVTSRQRLQIAAEWEIVVSSLNVPSEAMSFEQLAACDSMRLFIDRAQAVKPHFQLTAQNAKALSELCVRLEGLPLALELAAARTQVFTPSQMLLQLNDRFKFLTSRRRDMPERHRMLRATVDWSYRLLDPQLQRLFVRLSVFRSGWTPEDSVYVCEEETALDLLCQLQECSLITMDAVDSAGVRFRMLEMLRTFGAEQLSPDEVNALQYRHAAHYTRLATEIAREAPDRVSLDGLNRLEREHDNLRLALEYQLNTHNILHAARLCDALCEFWERRGRLREGALFLERCLALLSPADGDPVTRRLLGSAGWFAYLQGRHTQAYNWQQRKLELCRSHQDEDGECIALNNLGLVVQAQGNAEEAVTYFSRSLEIARRHGDTARLAPRLSNLGLLEIQEQRYVQARGHLQEAISLYRQAHNAYGIAACLCNLAKLAILEGAYAEATALGSESLRLFRETNDRFGEAYALASLGMASTWAGDFAQAAIPLHSALTLCRAIELDSLLPALLEILARNDVGKLQFTRAAYAIHVADQLRHERQMPRCRQEQETYAELQSAIQAALQRPELRTLRLELESLSREQILDRIVSFSSGDIP